MNREEKIAILKELRDCSLEFESYEVKEDDAEVLIWAINELERRDINVNHTTNVRTSNNFLGNS